MLATLARKNTALGKISSFTDFKTRKVIGTGLIMSSLSYMIQVFGGCSGYLLHMLQVQQNIAARHITKLGRMTPTKTLLNQCNWLSVKQLVAYHSIVLLRNILQEKKPTYIFNKLNKNLRETRTTDHLTLYDSRNFKTTTALKSFIPRTIKEWNLIPLEIRATESSELFKRSLKLYIKENITVK